MKDILVTVVVTSKNEEKKIRDCLLSIKKQGYKGKVEVIVVDNNSTDKTKEIAREFTKMVFNCSGERSKQRNFGIKKGKGKYIVFLDSDMRLKKDVIKKGVERLEKSDLGGLYIPEEVVGGSFWCRVRNFERKFYEGTVIDCVRMIRREVFLKAGGFDEELIGPEDWDLDKRIRKIAKAGVLKKGLIYHDESDFELRKYLLKKRYYAKCFDRYVKRWRKEDEDIKRQLGFWYRFLGVFVEKGKWKRLVRKPFLAGGMFFLRFLVGLVFLFREKEDGKAKN